MKIYNVTITDVDGLQSLYFDLEHLTDFLGKLEYGKVLTICVIINDENFNTGKAAFCDIKVNSKFGIIDKV